MSPAVVLFCLLVLVSEIQGLSVHGQERKHSRHGQFQDLEPQSPRTALKTEGGRVDVWEYESLKDASVAAYRTTLKPRALWLPAYLDCPYIAIVIAGSLRVGIITSYSDRTTHENVFNVSKGDVVAIPQGVTTWWYNDGHESAQVLEVAETVNSPKQGIFRAFHLAGATSEHGKQGKQEEYDAGDDSSFTAVLHGFSRKVLAQAWDLDEDMVMEVLKGQNGAEIVLVDEEFEAPLHKDNSGDNTLYRNLIYSLGEAHADVREENGGELRELSSLKLPVLKHMGMGVECMKLEPAAMVSPNWFHNAHQVLYVTKGTGRIQVVRNNGEQALNRELVEGDLVLVPEFFPSTKIAGDDGFHYISIVTNDTPTISYLSGRTSVYQGIPSRMLSRMLNVRKEIGRKIHEAHSEQSIIFAKEDVSKAYL